MANNGLITNLTLSDTCGTLDLDTFNTVVETLHCAYGLPYAKMGVHLHVSMADDVRKNITRNILWSAFDKQIGHYDVSSLKNGQGGCSVTMKGTAQMHPNLSGEFFNECLVAWRYHHHHRSE
jgi:hypothetical protein